MDKKTFHDELNRIFDEIAGKPSPILSDRVRSSIVEAQKPRDYYWIAGVAALLIAAMVVGVMYVGNPLNRRSTAGSNSSPTRIRPSVSPAGTCAATPPARSGASLAYDGARGPPLMFGGIGSTSSTNHTWLTTPDCSPHNQPLLRPPTPD